MAQALIHNNKVIQVEANQFDVASGLTWIQSTIAKVGDDFDTTLVGEARFSAPVSPAVIVTVDMIRAEARRRMQLNGNDLAAKKSTPLPSIATYIDGVIAACETLEISLPSDYTNDIHWPTVI